MLDGGHEDSQNDGEDDGAHSAHQEKNLRSLDPNVVIPETEDDDDDNDDDQDQEESWSGRSESTTKSESDAETADHESDSFDADNGDSGDSEDELARPAKRRKWLHFHDKAAPRGFAKCRQVSHRKIPSPLRDLPVETGSSKECISIPACFPVSLVGHLPPIDPTVDLQRLPVRGVLVRQAVDSDFAVSVKLELVDATSHAQSPPARPSSQHTGVYASKPTHVPSARPSRPNARKRQRHLFTSEEDGRLVRLVSLKEGRGWTWEDIAQSFPGRTCGSLQVRYSTKLRNTERH